MSVHAQRYTYLGLFDDYDYRLWGFNGQDVGMLEDVLVNAILVGHPIVINDGYLMQHPVLVSALEQDRRTLLRRLIQVGWVKILTRNQGVLSKLSEIMSWGGVIPGNRKHLEDADFLARLHGWAEQLDPAQSFVAFPGHDLGQGYAWWANRLLPGLEDQGWRIGSSPAVLPEQEVGPFVREFIELLGNDAHRAPRTKWEELVNQHVDRGSIHGYYRPSFLQLGSIIHQLNVGAALQSTLSDIQVDIETMSCTVTETDWHAETHTHDEPPDLPYLELPRDIDLAQQARVGSETERWGSVVALARLFLDRAQQHDPLVLARRRYLDGVAHAAAHGCTEAERRELGHHAGEYSRRLGSYFHGDKRQATGQQLMKSTFGFGIATVAAMAVADPSLAVHALQGAATVGVGLAVARGAMMYKPFSRALEAIGRIAHTPLGVIQPVTSRPHFWLPRVQRTLRPEVSQEYNAQVRAFA